MTLERIPLVLITTAVVGCADYPVALQNAASVEVVLDVYSGLPNPQWSLRGSDVAELTTKLANLPSVSSSFVSLAEDRLGYRGFVLRDTTDRDTESVW